MKPSTHASPLRAVVNDAIPSKPVRVSTPQRRTPSRTPSRTHAGARARSVGHEVADAHLPTAASPSMHTLHSLHGGMSAQPKECVAEHAPHSNECGDLPQIVRVGGGFSSNSLASPPERVHAAALAQARVRDRLVNARRSLAAEVTQLVSPFETVVDVPTATALAHATQNDMKHVHAALGSDFVVLEPHTTPEDVCALPSTLRDNRTRLAHFDAATWAAFAVHRIIADIESTAVATLPFRAASTHLSLAPLAAVVCDMPASPSAGVASHETCHVLARVSCATPDSTHDGRVPQPTPCLAHVSVRSTVDVGSGLSRHTAYVLRLRRVDGTEFEILRRYREFAALFDALQTTSLPLRHFAFPGKAWFPRSSSVVRERAAAFGVFASAAIAHLRELSACNDSTNASHALSAFFAAHNV